MFRNQTFVDDTAPITHTPQPVLATQDGHIVLSPVTGKQLGRTLEAVGHPEWKEDFKKLGKVMNISVDQLVIEEGVSAF